MKLKFFLISVLIVLFTVFSILLYIEIRKEPIEVGIIHSLSGTMAESERPMVNAVLLAIEEINSKGGLLGRKVKSTILDGQSSSKIFGEKAQMLVDQKITTIFGGWTSASRKEMKRVVEASNGLLFYPVQYEGAEASSHIVYTGLVPNQQVKPSLRWMQETYGKRMVLIGSDYIYPRMIGNYIHAFNELFNLKLLEEQYVPLGSEDFEAFVAHIKEKRPSFIINTLNGSSNIAFFKALKDAGISAQQIPVISFSLDEALTQAVARNIGAKSLEGHFVAWSYSQMLQTAENKQFLRSYRQKYGTESIVTDPMEAAYTAVMLWANTVKKVKSTKSVDIRKNIGMQSMQAPSGIVYVDPESKHLWKHVGMFVIDKNAHFKEVWRSPHLIKPLPFSSFISKEALAEQLAYFYHMWGESWEKQQKPLIEKEP